MRNENFAHSLGEVVRLHKSQPYSWGRFDCITFAGHCICAVTGKDYLALIENYDSQPGAARSLLETGNRSVFEFFKQHFEARPTALLRQGDIGFARLGGDGLSAPFVILGDCAINRDESGWHHVRLSQINFGFKVG